MPHVVSMLAALLRRRLRPAIVPLAVTAGLVVGCTPTTATTSYRFTTQQLAVASTESQQGLAYAGGLLYLGFDLLDGTGRIVGYDSRGRVVKRSAALPTGHTNEISYRTADGNLYVTNTSRGVTGIAVVSVRGTVPSFVKQINVPLKYGAVAAVDNTRDQLVVVTGNTGGPYTLEFVTMSGVVTRRIPIADQGITQGLEVVGDQILLFTSLTSPARDRITVLSLAGTVLQTIPVPVANEGEGLAYDPATRQVYVGFTKPSRVMLMTPAFVPVHL